MFEGMGSVYAGEYVHSVDAKGRVAVPSKWRPAKAEGAKAPAGDYLVLPMPSGYLAVLPPSMVGKLESKVAEVSLGDRRGRKALRKLFSAADTAGLDSQGRLNLSDRLKAHCAVGKEATLAGNFTIFEIWEPAAYAKHMSVEGMDEETDEMSEILKELGV